MKEIKKKIKTIDDRMKNFMEEIKLPLIKEPEYQQPATIEKQYFQNVKNVQKTRVLKA